jgi:hypothetical protein
MEGKQAELTVGKKGFERQKGDRRRYLERRGSNQKEA